MAKTSQFSVADLNPGSRAFHPLRPRMNFFRDTGMAPSLMRFFLHYLQNPCSVFCIKLGYYSDLLLTQ
jgi:hypothetical protein